MNVLVVDVGGTHIKILATGQQERREFASGTSLKPAEVVKRVKRLAKQWPYERVSIGYPGAVRHGKIVSEPHNLGGGWVEFDFALAFGCEIRLLNDAAMQALGGYSGGKMLFLGFGTGLGTALIADGVILPMELGYLPYKKGVYANYVGARFLKHKGQRKWQKHVLKVIGLFRAALQPDDILLGGGNAHRIKQLPDGCRLGDNDDAFTGGFRLWADEPARAYEPTTGED